MTEFKWLTKDLDWRKMVALNPDFNLEIAEEILNTAEKFGEDLDKVNFQADIEGVRLVDKKVLTPAKFKELYNQFKELGFNSLDMKEQYGGMNMPTLIYTAINNLIMKQCLAFSIYPGLTHAAMGVIEAFASEEIKNKYLPLMISGEMTGTMCLTEENCGTDLSLIRTKARMDNDKFLITGSKVFISGGDQDLSENIAHLVLAKTENKNSLQAISLFLVPKLIDNKLNVETARLEEKMGLHANSTAQLVFSDSIGYLIGDRGEGLKYMFKMMNEARLGVGIQAVSLMEKGWELSRAWAQERKTSFDINNLQSREKLISIENIPDVKKMLLFQGANIYPSKRLIFYVSHLFDLLNLEKDEKKKKELHKEISLLTPIVKAFISDRAQESIYQAMQIHGGHGYIRENKIEQLARDVRILPIYEGVNNIQYLDFTARKVMQQFKFYQKYLNKLIKESTKFKNKNRTKLLLELLKLKLASVRLGMAAKKDVKKIFEVSSELANIFANTYFAYLWLKLEENQENKKKQEYQQYLQYYFDYLLPRNKTLYMIFYNKI